MAVVTAPLCELGPASRNHVFGILGRHLDAAIETAASFPYAYWKAPWETRMAAFRIDLLYRSDEHRKQRHDLYAPDIDAAVVQARALFRALSPVCVKPDRSTSEDGLMEAAGPQGPNAGGGIMADILTEQVVASFFIVNLGLAIACLVRGSPATKPLIACALPIVCIVLPYAALVANPFLRCALHNGHVVDYAEALARAISADDNRFGH